MRFQHSYLEDFLNEKKRKINIIYECVKLNFNENYNEFYEYYILKNNYQTEFIYIISK